MQVYEAVASHSTPNSHFLYDARLKGKTPSLNLADLPWTVKEGIPLGGSA